MLEEITDQRPGRLRLQRLQKRFPGVLGKGVNKPLKIGILDDLVAVFDGQYCSREISHALSWHTRRRGYQQALADGGPRFNLDGDAAGVVSEAAQQAAREALARPALERAAKKLRSELLENVEASGLSPRGHEAGGLV